MKITIFGLTLSSSWGNGHATPYRAILRALHARGVDVIFFEKDVPYYARRRDLPEPQFCDLRLYREWDESRSAALRTAADSDVVITASYVPEGAQIADDLLNLSRPLRVFYDLDTPITLKRLAEGESDYLRRDQISQFDLYLSFAGGPILQELRSRYGAQCPRALYGCVDPDVYRALPPRRQWACDLSYMGTYARDRELKFRQMLLEPAVRQPELHFLLAGSMYPQEMSLPSNVKHVEHVSPAEHAQLYSSSRATLNITRAEMAAWGYCPSGRFFEATACGTPVITDRWRGLEEFFDLDSELLVADGSAEVVRALRLADSQLKQIASRARERTLQRHTGARRAEELLRYCEEARAGKVSAMEVAS